MLSAILDLSLPRTLDLSSRDVTDDVAFSKASVFAVHTESDTYSKRCVFKRFHYEERFQMYAFSMKTIAFLDHLSVKAKAHRNVCVFKRKRMSVDET